jgi:hypothetical protein
MTYVNIYKVEFDGSVVYVGQTNYSIEKRWSDHRSKAKTSKRKTKFHAKIHKYGPERFTVSLIESVDISIADERETHWINYHNTIQEGCNLASGGRVNRNVKISENQKKIIGDSNRTHYHNGSKLSQWNGSSEQKEMLRVKMKQRENTWGEAVAKARCGIQYRIMMDGQEYTTYSLTDFSKEHGLVQPSLWYSLKENRPTKTRGHHVQVFAMGENQ